MAKETGTRRRPKSEVGARLKAERLRRGLSQEGMARKLELKKPTYVSYEYGRSEPPLAVVARACEVLGLRPGGLLGVERDRSERSSLLSWEVQGRLDRCEREGYEVFLRLAAGESVELPEAEIEQHLRELFSENLVRITRLTMDPDLGAAVAERLGLDEVKVVRIPGAVNSPFLRALLVAEAGKQTFIEKLQPNIRIGITGGFLISRMLDALSRRELRDVPPFEIFPIAVSPFERVSVSPNTVLGHLYYRNFERSLRAHGLMFATPESQKDLRETMRVLDGATGSDLVFLGLGDFDLRQRLADSKEADTMRSLLYARGFNFQRIVEEEKAVGDIMFFPVDAAGEPILLDELSDLICSIGLERLRKLSAFYRIPVVAVVSGGKKRDIVLAAARGRYVNTAIMETELAEALIA